MYSGGITFIKEMTYIVIKHKYTIADIFIEYSIYGGIYIYGVDSMKDYVDTIIFHT